MGKKLFKPLIRAGSVLLFLAFIILTGKLFEIDTLQLQMQKILSEMHWLVILTCCYFSAFVLRAVAWKVYLNGTLPLNVYLSALFYSLFFNHILPFKAGEIVRIGVLAKEQEAGIDTAAHSVVVMRFLDLVCLGSIALVGAVLMSVTLDYHFFFLLLAVSAAAGLSALIILRKKHAGFYRKHLTIMQAAFTRKKSPLILGLVFISWILEAVVLFVFVRITDLEMLFLEAIWANSLTVASGVFQFAPGGLATYESVLSFALVQSGIGWTAAYHLAVLTHGYKFLFSFAAGALAFITHPVPLFQMKSWILKKGEQA